MINFILSLIQDPKKGYDPVPPAHVEKYFEEAYNGQRFNQNIIDRLENTLSLNNKKVLDLGAGPGQYTKYFVDQGAKAYYHDISLRYLRLFQEKFPNLKFNYTIDYLDNFKGTYDLIFNNVCFCYSMDDYSFVKKIEKGLNPNGIYFGILGNENVFKKQLSKRFLIKIQYYLNDYFGIKIGHPFTSRKRTKKLFSPKRFEIITIEDFEENTLVIVKRKHK
ncbi:MAG: class I SAM-dependent methyltransferase [Flavobacteriaceae bacterium]